MTTYNISTKNFLEKYHDGNLNNYPHLDDLLYCRGVRDKINFVKMNDPMKSFKPFYERFYSADNTPSAKFDRKTVELSQILYNKQVGLDRIKVFESRQLDIYNPVNNGLQTLQKPYLNFSVSIANKMVADAGIPSQTGINFYASTDIPQPTQVVLPKEIKDNSMTPTDMVERSMVQPSAPLEVNHNKRRKMTQTDILERQMLQRNPRLKKQNPL
jgi:hypothetical protein